MKIASVSCSLLLLVGALLLTSCATRPPATSEPDQSPSSFTDQRGFDPLALPGDDKVIPEDVPLHGDINGGGAAPADGTTEPDSVVIPAIVPDEVIDSLNNQAFRVQLFSGKLYGDARREAQVAEEIFDRPVVIDYEVPYFKVRVGSFAEREDAEDYQKRAQAAGYDNAWVVLVTVNVQSAEPLYDAAPDAVLDEIIEEPVTDDEN